MSLKSDFKSIKNYVFDLDDTLYPPSEEIFGQMAARIRSFIMNLLGVDNDAAHKMQENYYKKYGATVRGLILEHNIAPEEFNDYVHTLDLSSLNENKELKQRLTRLSGHKFIFTNGAYEHAERVSEKLGIGKCFDGIFSIREANYIPKPAEETFRRMLGHFKINPDESVMFDDSQVNLKSAHNVGMKTVWITHNDRDNRFNTLSETPDFCDYTTDDLISFLKKI